MQKASFVFFNVPCQVLQLHGGCLRGVCLEAERLVLGLWQAVVRLY